MNRKNEWLAVLFVAVFFIAGCGNHSGLKGKIIDGKGQPVTGLTIIAKQVQPIEGYEKLKTVTDSNGEFHFKKLYPSSEYVLKPLITDWHQTPFMVVEIEKMQIKSLLGKKGWFDDNKLSIQTAAKGETALLASPIILKLPLSISLGMEFVYIEPGTFMMGSPEYERGRFDDETQHQVTLTEGYYIQTTPVTQDQWEAVIGDNPSYFDECGGDCPVENVSWYDAQDFISALNNLEDTERYALPTEAQWEYAARGGRETPFYFGRCLSTDQANYNGNYPLSGCPKGEYREKTTPVKMFPANVGGLYDMHGNVWEWVADRYGPYPSSAVTDPKGPSSGIRVLRGGSWASGARHCRSANRFSNRIPGLNRVAYSVFMGNRCGVRLVFLPGH